MSANKDRKRGGMRFDGLILLFAISCLGIISLLSVDVLNPNNGFFPLEFTKWNMVTTVATALAAAATLLTVIKRTNLSNAQIRISSAQADIDRERFNENDKRERRRRFENAVVTFVKPEVAATRGGAQIIFNLAEEAPEMFGEQTVPLLHGKMVDMLKTDYAEFQKLMGEIQQKRLKKEPISWPRLPTTDEFFNTLLKKSESLLALGASEHHEFHFRNALFSHIPVLSNLQAEFVLNDCVFNNTRFIKTRFSGGVSGIVCAEIPSKTGTRRGIVFEDCTFEGAEIKVDLDADTERLYDDTDSELLRGLEPEAFVCFINCKNATPKRTSFCGMDLNFEQSKQIVFKWVRETAKKPMSGKWQIV